ncbi:MAG: hypothetical protein E7812_12515 [Phenylobacterium sp.]|nr:MAG: hypothetical protein E7812_12515 [Phenylobacterium sp.]
MSPPPSSPAPRWPDAARRAPTTPPTPPPTPRPTPPPPTPRPRPPPTPTPRPATRCRPTPRATPRRPRNRPFLPWKTQPPEPAISGRLRLLPGDAGRSAKGRRLFLSADFTFLSGTVCEAPRYPRLSVTPETTMTSNRLRPRAAS